MPKLVIVQALRPIAYETLKAHPDIEWQITEDVSAAGLIESIADADAVTIRVAPLPEEVLRSAPNLKVISRHGVGYDNVPIEFCTRQRIAVAITANANSVSVAEHAVFLMLAAARNVNIMDNAVRSNQFNTRLNHVGLEMQGRTLLIVGFGRIGRLLAQRARAFGMNILVYDPYLTSSSIEGVTLIDSLECGLRRANILSLHVPLTERTRNMIGHRELDMMPNQSIIVNASRGGLIDEFALLEKVNSGKIHGAGIDTFTSEPPPPDSPLLANPRIVLSPHSAALTEESLNAMGCLAIQNAIDGIRGALNHEMVVNPSVLDTPPNP